MNFMKLLKVYILIAVQMKTLLAKNYIEGPTIESDFDLRKKLKDKDFKYPYGSKPDGIISGIGISLRQLAKPNAAPYKEVIALFKKKLVMECRKEGTVLLTKAIMDECDDGFEFPGYRKTYLWRAIWQGWMKKTWNRIVGDLKAAKMIIGDRAKREWAEDSFFLAKEEYYTDDWDEKFVWPKNKVDWAEDIRQDDMLSGIVKGSVLEQSLRLLTREQVKRFTRGVLKTHQAIHNPERT